MRQVSFRQAALPVVVLIGLIGYGLIARPLWLGQSALPLETIFMVAAAFAIAQLLWLGESWKTIQSSIVKRLSRALPAFFILLTIGVVIGSWMVAGTIPMLVYYGLSWIQPNLLYLTAFVVTAIFSTLTGTSWGSAGSIGVVMIGIAGALDAQLGIAAGAIIGGAYFGDKLSPLSDTTNMAAIATDVEVNDHIRSMLNTTGPSAILAALSFLALGFVYPPAQPVGGGADTAEVLTTLRSMFRFHPLLLIPPLTILIGSLRRLPSIPTMMASILSASILALLIQPYALTEVGAALHRGYTTEMAPWMPHVPESVAVLVNRGGIYALIDAVVVAFTVFFFIGTIDRLDSMRRVVDRIFGRSASRRGTILASLGATALTSSLTTNQYATSFIIGDAFKARYDAVKVPRKVLSRSLEDAGTMLESQVPWTPTAVFMTATLGVSWAEYAPWQLLSMINLVVAPLLAILGIGCFYRQRGKEKAGTPQ
jgi:NhaC family Na+:H+ antiporter